MIIAIDVLLGLTILISIIVGAKQGFIKSVVGFLRFVIAFILANTFYPTVASLARKLIGVETVPISDEKTGIIEFIRSVPEKLSTVDTETAREMFISVLFEIGAFLLIFFAVVLIIKFIAWIIEKNTRIPGLSFANKFLGGVFGAFCGLFWTWLLAGLFSNYLLDWLVENSPELFYEEMRDDFFVKFCAETNPLVYLFSAVDKLASKFQI